MKIKNLCLLYLRLIERFSYGGFRLLSREATVHRLQNKINRLLPISMLIGICLVISCKASQQITNTQKKIPPNIFLFLADDLSKEDLGITGNPYVTSPTIDNFASRAISFENMYTPSAMCAPSRSALMTGLYPHRNGCHMNHGSIYKEIKSLPTYLKSLGYQVALVGKRHIRPAENFPYEYLNYDELDDYLATVTKPLCLIYASNDPHGPHLESLSLIHI